MFSAVEDRIFCVLCSSAPLPIVNKVGLDPKIGDYCTLFSISFQISSFPLLLSLINVALCSLIPDVLCIICMSFSVPANEGRTLSLSHCND